MIPVLSREKMRAFDRRAIEDCRVPSLILMENAGRGAAEVIESLLAERRAGGIVGAQVVVLCGPGNNGGDGFVVARRLLGRGARVLTFLTTTADRLQGDARLNHDAWRGLGGNVAEIADESAVADVRGALEGADLIVDALLGTGLDRDVAGRMKSLIDLVNQVSAPAVALDIPSGLDCNRGVALGVAIEAVATVTFAHYKLGLLCTEGAEYCGQVHVADIGVPASLYEVEGADAELVQPADVARAVRRRSVSAHKGSVGRVLAICGAPGKIGAALLVAQAAQRAGAGLVTVATLPEAAAALDQRVVEAMTARIDPDRLEQSLDQALAWGQVVAIGPGLGLDRLAARMVDHVVLGWDGVKVVDADALTHFVDRAEQLHEAPGQCVLTPHPGEMGRLLGCSAAEVEADRFGAVDSLVQATGAVVLLKGPRSLIGAPGCTTCVTSVDCPALATGGTGDVLTGVCAALACTLDARTAAYCAAYLHGRAAFRWSERVGADRGLLAREVADGIPGAIAWLAAEAGELPD